MKRSTPEQAGIASRYLIDFFDRLEYYGLSTHSVLMARGDNIFCECYYKPFHKDFKHRMYSVSKSFVSVAVGFCEQDGFLSLDDPMLKFFPEYNTEGAPNATVREMLMMESAVESHCKSWFRTVTNDRVACYFTPSNRKTPGTLFSYDSAGSYMLGVIVERMTGKPFLEYLKEKVLLDIGFSKDAYCLQAPGGYSWGDSGVMCTAEDLMLFARFVLNMGTFEGKRYLNEDYLRAATTMSVCNSDYGFCCHDNYGYGYQFWGAPKGCFAMLGMGNQIALCDPKHDFIFVINSDNQGNPHNYEQIFEALYNNVIAHLEEERVPERAGDVSLLREMLAERELFFLRGAADADFSKEIAGKRFACDPNPMGLKWFTLSFGEGEGTLHYENAQGEKALTFGFGHNAFQKFPQSDYPDLVGVMPAKGNRYDCACSADWPEPQKLRIRVQIIDKYFGNLAIVIGFKDDAHASVRMTKKAEYFLMEYEGLTTAKVK
ncbi:MAG: serine hydrolase [Clostridia bacterium]|nr:serine hydrolase [Clostridia bacterium]